MNGTELVVRHSFAPNRLRYCGQSDLSREIPAFVSNQIPSLETRLQLELKSFKGLYSYLSLIGQENGLNPFDEKVGEAYWIGNRLLEKVPQDAMQKLFLEKFSSDDFLGKELALELAQKIPVACVPHHSFHVFFTHFMTNAVPVTLPNLEKCRVSWGKIIEIRKGELFVEFEPLEFDRSDNFFYFGDAKIKAIENPFFDSLSIGDWVSFHWNTFCMKISNEQKDSLELFTKQNLKAINNSGK